MEIPRFARDDRYVFEAQRERSGEPQTHHSLFNLNTAAAHRFFPSNFTPKVLSSRNSDKPELAKVGGMRDLLLAAGTYIKKMCIKISFLKEGWPGRLIIWYLQYLFPGRGGWLAT
jgi:hypothetical protein